MFLVKAQQKSIGSVLLMPYGKATQVILYGAIGYEAADVVLIVL